MEEKVIYLIVPLIAGVGLMSTASRFRAKRKRLLENGIPVEGIVYSMPRTGEPENATIRFLTLEDEWITKEYEVGYTSGILKEGQPVSVYYNKDNPEDFLLNTNMDKWLPFLISVIGIACLIFSFGYLIIRIL